MRRDIPAHPAGTNPAPAMHTAPGMADVAVVGYGPVGVTLAGLLGREGLEVAVFEKAAGVYPQPRAVGFDHDAMRLFQRIGAADALAPHITDFRDTEFRGVDGQLIQRVQRMQPPYPYTWAPNYTCDQPGVEAVLRAVVATQERVRVHLQHELVRFVQHPDHVELTLRGPDGELHAARARYLVGCDGASSSVRRLAGLPLDSLDYEEPWLVVDLQVGPDALSLLPSTNVQYCEPERPCTYIVCPGNHRRWEFMRLPDELGDGELSPERLWALLARWLQPHEAYLWRAASYRFHALVARDWRAGRVLLAGDSAHQTPPFMGQGMCQGLRDAGNLAWKLAAVMREGAPETLLDSYTAERSPHVQATTRQAMAFGQVLGERDPARARQRDQSLRAAGEGRVPTLVRQELIPPLAAGLIDGRGNAAAHGAGQPLPQPRVHTASSLAAEHEPAWLDDLADGRWHLVWDHAALNGGPTHDADDGHAKASLLAQAGALGWPCFELHAPAPPPFTQDAAGIVALTEHQAVLAPWLKSRHAAGALVRPDHCVYGGFADATEALELLAEAAMQLRREALASPAALPVIETS